MKYVISKKFTIDCAHRVYNQQVEGGKCKHIHGHTYEFEVFLESDTLDHDMVLDFTYLKIVKDFLDKYLDHRLLVCIDDIDLIETLNMLLRSLGKCNAYGPECEFEFVSLNPDVLKRILSRQYVLKLEHYNPLINSVTLLPCNTTSERLAEWLLIICKNVLSLNVSKVSVKETPKSYAEVNVNTGV